MDIRPLGKLSFHKLYATWNEAYKGYVREWTKEELAAMLHRRGYMAELSFGAFDNGELVSFTLNGIGEWKGQKAAYDTGTGTISAYRGKGLATSIFNASVPFLKEAGIKQYLLEVLQDNAKAISVYQNIGFITTRSFNYFVQEVDKVISNEKVATNSLRIIDLPGMSEVSSFWDFMPSWQNSHAAIMRQPGDFTVIGAYDNERLTGYGIIEPTTGDIPQLAVDNNYRRRGTGSVLLQALLQQNKAGVVRIINTDAVCEPMTAFLENNGIKKSGGQYEMLKKLDQ